MELEQDDKMAITPELKNKTEETKKLIATSKLTDEKKQHWDALLDFALENCNGLTQEQKIQGIAELLLEHTRILAERAVVERDEEAAAAMEAISKKVDELTQVQQNQQSMMKGLHDNMEKLFQLTDMLRTTNERIGSLEAREVEDNKSQDNRINTVFTKTSDDIMQIRNDIGSIREDVKQSQQVFLQKLDEYTTKLSNYDKEQDAKNEARFKDLGEENKKDRKNLRDKLDSVSISITELKKQMEEPQSWKGVVARLFSKYTVLVIILVILATLAFNPHALDSVTSAFAGQQQKQEQVSEK